MSDETNKIKISMAKIEKDIDFIKDALGDNGAQHKEIIDKMDAWIEHAEKRFASKWVELVLKGVIGVMGTAVILYAMKLVLK